MRGSGDLGLLRRVLAQARPQALPVLGLLALELLAAPLALLAPLPLKIVVDSVLDDHPAPGPLAGLGGDSHLALLLAVAGLLVLVAGSAQLQSLGSNGLRTAIGERLTLDFRSRIFRHAQRLSFSYHDMRGTADPTYRIQHDSEAIRFLVADGAAPFLGAAVTLVAMLVQSFRLDWRLASIALAVSPVLFLLSRAYRGHLRSQSRQVKALESAALSVIQEVLTSLRVVKAFSGEDREQRRFESTFGQGMRARLRLVWTESGLGLLIGLTTALGTAAVLVVGALDVRQGRLTQGSLLMVLGYLAQLYAPLKTMSRKVASVQLHLASAERAFELLDQPPDVAERPHARRLRRARGALAFEEVTFAYAGGPPVLRALSFEIAAGSRVGLAGETGAGKSTLAALLLRFYDPTAGRILLDGVDLREFALRDLREQFAVVPQDTVLFSTSIAENIAYARPGASAADLVAAARAAGAHGFVEALPEGYGTLVGERGLRLSGGERQRIALARAFLRDAPILVLDEPTSALDPGTESGVLEALERLMRDRTTLIIAHRASTLETCDRVLTLQDGSIVTLAGAAS